METEPSGRIIDSGLIDQAETARKTGKFAKALVLARKSLQFDRDNPFTQFEMMAIAQNPAQLTLLATAARLIFDTSRSQMKRSVLPQQVHRSAEQALEQVGKTVYQSPTIRNALQDIKENNQGESYDYDHEYARDVAGYLVALSYIFPGEEGKALVEIAHNIWDLLLDSIDPRDIQNRSFFILEKNWFLFTTGGRDKIDTVSWKDQLRDFDHTAGDNIDRRKTVAARTHIMTDKMKLGSISRYALSMLAELDQLRAVDDELAKRRKEFYQKIILKVLAPTSGLGAVTSRSTLYDDSYRLGSNQWQRLHNARK